MEMSTNRLAKALLSQLRHRCFSHQDLHWDCTCPGCTCESLKPSWLGWWEAVTSQRDAHVLGELTFDTGLNLPIPLPAGVTEQCECRLLVAHDVSLGANVEQLVPHFKASVAMQDGVGEGGRVPTGLIWKEKKKWDCRGLAMSFEYSPQRVNPRTNLCPQNSHILSDSCPYPPS